MAYNEYFAERIRQQLQQRGVAFTEKKMMGGLTFMVDEKMYVGLVKERFMARVGPDAHPEALLRNGAEPMDFTGRPMKGYVFVRDEGTDRDEDLDYWMELALAFNPLAKASKKRVKKKK